jgi:hypothetical protein
MEQSPSWEANSHSASQEIPRLLWILKVHYLIHKTIPLVPILSQMHQVHTSPHYLPKIHSNITLLSMPRSSEWSLLSGFQTKVLYEFLKARIRATCPAHFILLGLVTLITLREAYKLWSSSLCSLHQPPATDILLSTLLLGTLCPCSSLSVRDQVSHPHKTHSILTTILKYLTETGNGFWLISKPANRLRKLLMSCGRYIHV